LDVVRLPVVCGPTAAGKSAIAMAIAGAEGAAIVSADSRQVFRGFDIGTAKPSSEDLARVPHLGVDVADPRARYSAARWVAEAERGLDAIAAQGRRPLIVGGTGFYLRALFDPLFEEPALDPARRAALEQELQPLSTNTLRRWCVALDPARAHLGRTQLLRAIEVALLSGTRISELHARTARGGRYAARYLVVDPGPSLAARIEHRVDEMLARGWTAEVERLARELPEDAPAWNATGYGLIRQVVTGAMDIGPARERVVIETRQYAKRQRTWFRHQLPRPHVVYLDPNAPDALDRALAWWHAEERS
jgi:tRNA dimethylallyltransferase